MILSFLILSALERCPHRCRREMSPVATLPRCHVATPGGPGPCARDVRSFDGAVGSGETRSHEWLLELWPELYQLEVITKKTSFIKCIIPLKSPVITFINGHVSVKPLLMDGLMNDEPWGFKHHCLINTKMGKVYFDIKNTIQLWPFISYNWL